MEDLRLPAQGVPVELLDGPREVGDRQVGDEPPVDRRAIGGRVELASMNVGEDLRAVALLLADGWQSLDDCELDLQASGLAGVAADGHAVAA